MSPKGIEIQEAKTWVCLVCTKQYQYLGALKNHVKKEHPDAWDAAEKAEREARKAEKEAKEEAKREEPEASEDFEEEEPGGTAEPMLKEEEPEAVALEELEIFTPEEIFTPGVEAKAIEGESPLSMSVFPGIPTKAQKQYPFEEIWTASPDRDKQLLNEAVTKARPPARLEDVISFAFYDTDVVFVLMDGRKIRVDTTQK